MRMSDWSADVCSSDLGAYSAEGQEVSADGDTATVLGAPLGLSADAIAVALLALEQQGYVMRGTFTPEAIAARDTEWRSAGRRGGNECVSTCMSTGLPYHSKKICIYTRKSNLTI